jgi:hypothetical protein
MAAAEREEATTKTASTSAALCGMGGDFLSALDLKVAKTFRMHEFNPDVAWQGGAPAGPT